MKAMDKYLAAKSRAQRIRRHAERFGDRHWDKLGGTVKLVDTYAGVYGNSSCSPWDDVVVKAVQDQLGNLLEYASELAAEKAEREVLEAAKAAKAEAEEVLAVLEEGTDDE